MMKLLHRVFLTFWLFLIINISLIRSLASSSQDNLFFNLELENDESSALPDSDRM